MMDLGIRVMLISKVGRSMLLSGVYRQAGRTSGQANLAIVVGVPSRELGIMDNFYYISCFTLVERKNTPVKVN